MEDALFLCPKPPLRDFTKAMGTDSTMPSWRSGNNHGFLRHRRALADCFGANPVASALGNRSGRDPGTAVRTYHVDPKRALKTGTFYFGGNRNFLLWSDTSDPSIFEAARLVDAIVLTKDRDFVDLVRRRGSPPGIIWITCGNTSNHERMRVLDATFEKACELLASGEPVIEIKG